MANWLDNTLCICGPAKTIAKFKNKAAGVYPADVPQIITPLNFHSFLPIPIKVLKAGGEILRTWEEKNWGCQYGSVNSQLIFEKAGVLTYWFESKWAPPIALLQSIAQKWPNLKIELISEDLQGGHKNFHLLKGTSEVSLNLRIWERGDIFIHLNNPHICCCVNDAQAAMWCTWLARIGIQRIICLSDEAQLETCTNWHNNFLATYRKNGFNIIHKRAGKPIDTLSLESAIRMCHSQIKASNKPLLIQIFQSLTI